LPTPTYIALANITIASAASTISFTSIPATYRDLVLVINGQLAINNFIGLRLNSDSGANYPQVMMRSNSGGSTESGTDTGTSIYANWSQARAGDRYTSIFQLMDYSATDKHKTVLSRNNYTDINPLTRVEANASRWANTAAVSSLTLVSGTNALAAGFTASLYGIAS
jgi:hypothetical protein